MLENHLEVAPIPRLLYGTAWKEERTQHLTKQAISAGFRGIDTANQRKHYFEAAVGKAVQEHISAGAVSRAQLFLQTKYTFRDGQDHRLPYDPKASIETQVRQSFESSLQHFATDYLDSFVLHGPTSRGALSRLDIEAWRALEGLANDRRVRFIGVSNFTLAQLQELLKLAHVKPKFLQNRCYARTGWDRELRLACAENGVVYQGFSLLTANRRELENARVRKIGERTGWSVAEIVFRFAVQVGMLPLTGTSDAEHMRLDLRAVETGAPALEATEVEAIERALV
jgi:diketogulonate reductase-like aldo/keto reductase